MLNSARMLCCTLVIAMVACWTPVAGAQDGEDLPHGWFMDVQRYHPTFNTLGGFQVESAQALELWHPAFGLTFNYANRPLAWYDRTGEGREFGGALVANMFAMDLQAAIGFRYADFGIMVPVTLAMKSNTDAIPGFPTLDESYAGAGDIRFAVRGRILDPTAGPIGLGILLPLSLPTGNSWVYNGSYGATFTPQILVETLQGRFHAALNIGPHLTSTVRYLDPDGEEVLRNGPEFRMGLHAGYRVVEMVDVSGELLMGFGLGGEGNATRNPVEWRIGSRIHPTQWLSLNVALGAGLSPGIGAPAFRFLFGATFTPSLAKDTDKDRVADKADACPEAPEDRDGFEDQDGCPDPDNDADGVLDENDQCPEELETANGFEDEDGCPDVNPDNDGDGLANATDACPDEAEDRDGFEDEDGCPDLDDDGDGVPDTADTCPDQFEIFNGVEDGDGCPDEGPVLLDLATGEIRLLRPLAFLSKKAVLEDDAKEILDAVAAVIVARPDLLTVEVQVHTDDQGDEDFNLRFSDARSQIIRLYLIDKGVAEDRLTAKGYGETRPLVEGASEKARAANRRVQFVILDRAE